MDHRLTKELFELASNYIRTIAGSLKSDDLLYLYSRFKQANEGPCNTGRPGFFDFQGKQKWDAWNALKCKSSEECMIEYIAKVTSLDPDWEENCKSKSQHKSCLGLGVSRMTNDEQSIEDSKKTLSDWCKEGNLDQVERILNVDSNGDIDALDENGIAPLHWSCDRGHKDVVTLLLRKGAKVNVQDLELQTPLHYAVSCSYPEIVQVLLECGADNNICDADGNKAMDDMEKELSFSRLSVV